MSGEPGAEESELDTRERLVRSAVEVFLEKGYGGARVQDIARKAGYTAGALYVHFPSRTALLGEAIVMEGESIIDSLIQHFAVTPGNGSVSRALAEYATAESGSLDVLLLEALALASRDKECRDMLAAALDRLEASIGAQIDRAMKNSLIDPSIGAETLGTFFSSWILGTMVHRAVGLRRTDTESMFELCERVTASMLPGWTAPEINP